MVTAGAPSIPVELKKQLKINGKMVIPVGGESRQEMVLVTRISEEDYKTEKFGKFVFVPMLKGTVKDNYA